MSEQLKKQIKVVAEARQRAQEAMAAKNSSYVEWENGNRMLLDAVIDTKQSMNNAEIMLRELVLKAYSALPVLTSKSLIFAIAMADL